MPIKKTETARERKDTGETAFIITSCINVQSCTETVTVSRDRVQAPATLLLVLSPRSR